MQQPLASMCCNKVLIATLAAAYMSACMHGKLELSTLHFACASIHCSSNVFSRFDFLIVFFSKHADILSE